MTTFAQSTLLKCSHRGAHSGVYGYTSSGNAVQNIVCIKLILTDGVLVVVALRPFVSHVQDSSCKGLLLALGRRLASGSVGNEHPIDMAAKRCGEQG